MSQSPRLTPLRLLLPLCIFLIIGFLLVPNNQAPPVHAYETDVHEQFNRVAAQLVQHNDSTNKRYEEIYLSDHIDQLGQGGIAEDNQYAWMVPTACADGRFMRHFYQPGSGQGLPPVNGDPRCMDAVTWARSSASDGETSGEDLTWTGAIDTYDYTAASRSEAYLRVGHVAHLIGDMAQPDHVHVHAHPKQDYEEWASGAFAAPPVSSLTIRNRARLEDFLIEMATMTYQGSTFQGGPLTMTANPLNPLSEFGQMFIVEWSAGIFVEDQWELYNRTAAGTRGTHLGNWDGSYGTGMTNRDDEWWETIAETGGGLYGAGFYTLEGDMFRSAVPPVYKGAANTQHLAQIYLNTYPPRAIEYIAGMYHHFYDIVNHPPYVYKVTVTQAGRCVYEQHWENEESDDELTSRTLEDDCNTPEDERWISTEDGPVEVKIEFGDNFGDVKERVQNVVVKVGNVTVQGQLDSDKTTWTGTFTPPRDGSLDGERAIEITAQDMNNHYESRNYPGNELDADPASPAKAGSAEPYHWQGYTTGPDKNHKIKIDTRPPDIRIRYRTEGPRCNPRYVLRAEVTDAGSGDGRSGLLKVTSSGGSANPASDPQTVQIGSVGVGDTLEYWVEAEDRAGNTKRKAARQPGPPRPPGCDHSDDNFSAASPQVQVGTTIPFDDEPPRVAVLSNGFAPDASGFVNALHEPNILVQPDFSPDIVTEYPLLVIPSGGLYGLENSAYFKAALEEYARRGGTIIVFDQQRGSDYGILPGGEVGGYGWAEDNSCTLSSLYIRHYDQVVSGFDDALLNSNVDGYFTSLPTDAEVLLHRSKNGQPALIRYNYEGGTIIATTAYDDWGVTNWQTTADAYILNRDLLAWAVDPALLPEFDPGQPVALPVVVTNNSAAPAAAVRLSLLAPGKQIIAEETQAISLSEGGTASVTFNTTANRPLGIWRVDYTLLDAEGYVIQDRQPGERFVVKDPHPLSAPVKDVSLTVNAPTEDFVSGSLGEFTFTVFNNTNVSKTLTVRYGLPHHTWETGDAATYGNFSNLSQTVVVGPNSQEQFLHVFPMRTNDRLFAYLYEGSSQRDATWFQTRKAPAVANTTLTMGQAEYGRNQTVTAAASLTNLAGASLNFQMALLVTAPNGSTVYTETVDLAVAGGTSGTADFSFALPPDAVNGTYRVKVDVTQSGARISGAVAGFALPNSPATFQVLLPGELPAGTEPLQVVVQNPHAYLPVTGTVGLVLIAPSGVTNTLAAQPYALGAGQTTTLEYDVAGVAAAFGSYQFTFTASDQYNQRSWTQSGQVAVTTDIQFSQTSYAIREALDLTVVLRNEGNFGVTPQITLNIPELAFNDIQDIPLGIGQTVVVTYSLPLPTTLEPEFHDIYLSTQVGTTISNTHRFYIPPSRVIATLDLLGYMAGETVSVPLTNYGGVDAVISGTLELIDQYGVVIAQSTVSNTIQAQQVSTTTLIIPDGAVNGTYLLLLKGQNLNTGAPTNLQRNLAISGVAASLIVETGEPAYFSDEEIATFADMLVSSSTLEGGDLNLRICSANSTDGGVSITPPKITYNSETVPFNWIDIASGGAAVARGTNTYTLVNLGFSFEFYGNTYTQMYVSSNGFVSFGNAYTTSSNTAIPNVSGPNNAIYVLWDYLSPTGGQFGSVYAQQIDTNRYVVQWQGVTHCCSTGSPETFQLILDGSDDSFTMQYLDVSNTSSATVGTENNTGTSAVQVAFNQSGIIDDGLALHFAAAQLPVEETQYTSANVPFNWIDIASGGAVVAQSNDTSTQVNIGFPFQFYGITYTQMFVGSNGLISFGSGYTHNSNVPIPNGSTPNNAIYALWDDLYPIGNQYGNVYVQQIDATRTVVQWQAVAHCCSTGAPETFQVILDGSDHSITLQYLDVTNTASATVGVENSNGTEAIMLVYNQSGVINDGTALKFAPALVTIPDTNYSSAAATFNWRDIAPDANLVAMGNDTATYVELGFPFQFYGITYTHMYIDSNGYVSFDYAGGYPFNTDLPDPNYPNNAIYAFWDDLNPSGGNNGAVFAKQVGPSRYVVQWHEVSHCCTPGATETVQLILDGTDHSATIQYLQVGDASNVTVGVENAAGTQAVQYTGVITNNLALRFETAQVQVPEINYANAAAPLNWQDVSATGNVVAAADDTYEQVSIGFPFSFYGITYTEMFVSSNGYLTFGDGYSSYSNDFIPNPYEPNNAIYALWTDLYPVGSGNGNIYTELISPTRRVIQWEEVSHCCSPGAPETFQVILDGSDNSITLQYLDLSEADYAVAGTENAAGTAATLIAYYDPFTLTDGAAFQLTPQMSTITVTNYITTTTPFNWEDIGVPTGTKALVGSGTFMNVDIGFPFQFYGITQTQMFVGSNGFVTFEAGYTNSSNGSIPSTAVPNNAIYALWDSLYPIGNLYGEVYARQISPTLTVIQWEGVMHCCNTSYPETFQIILDGSDHTITLQYEDVSLTNSATVGIENRSGTRATQIAYNQTGIINDGTAFKLTPSTQYIQVTSYLTENVILDWEEIAPPADTRVLVGGNTYTQVDLGFPFQFYGITQTQMYVGSNGFVSFGTPFTNSSNGAIPNTATPNNAIYALWDSLNPTGGANGQVYMRQTGPTQYVVQWQGVTHCCSGANPETFQIILDGSNNNITLQYEDVNLTNSATVGVENEYGLLATQIAFNQSGVIADGLALQLTPQQQTVLRPTFITSTVTLDWINIAPDAGTEVVAVGTNTFTQVPLGFPFKFYGQTYNDIYVGSNGYVTFGAGATSNANVAIPNYQVPNNAIFALWDYLAPRGGSEGQIYVRQTGPTQFVVQWQGVSHCCSGTNPETFQIILDGSDNTITLQYEDVSLTTSATVGVENEFGTRGTQIAFNQSGVITDGQARRLTPIVEEVPPPPICDPTVPQPLDLMLVIDRSGSMSGQPFTDAKFAAKAFVDFMDLGIDRVGLASFETSAALNHVLSHDGVSVKAAIDALVTAGTTAIGEGVAVAHAQLMVNPVPGVTPVIVLLSDGQNNAGRDPLTAANAAKADGIKIVTIGLGSGADVALLRAMASTEDDYHFAPASSDLQNIFASIANSICRSPLPFDASCGGYVMWETTVPVTVTTSLNISELAGPLDVSGRMNLDGRLFAQTGQLLAHDNYPFYLHDRDTALTLETDHDFYRPGETITVSGFVTNTSALAVNTDLRVWADDVLLIDQPLSLAPGEGYAYTTIFTDTANLAVTNATFIAAANGVSVYKLVVVDAPQLEARLDVPGVVGREPFLATLTITNTGRIPAAVEAAISGVVSQTISLQPGGVARLQGPLSITQDTVVVAPITGDLNQTLSENVIFGEAAALAFTPDAVYPVGPVTVPYLIDNTGLLAVSFDTQLVLRDGSGTSVATFTVPADLPAGAELADLLYLGVLNAGEYTLEYTAFFGNGSEPFTVVAPEGATLAAAQGAAVGITIPVTATVTNTGLLPFSGQVTLSTSFYETSAPVTDLPVGASTEIVLPVNTGAAAAGDHPVQLTLLNVSGALVDDASLTLTIGGPNLVLTDLPTNLTLPVSTTVTMTFGVANLGDTAGDGILSFTFSDIADEEQYIWLSAGDTGEMQFTFFIPPEMEAKTYPVNYAFNGVPGVLLLTIEGIEIGVEPSLDRAGYYEGETAQLTLHVTELANRPTLPLYALVQFNEYSAIQPFTLTPSGTADVTFNVPVSFLGDEKVFYGIYDVASDRSIHLNTVYLPQLHPDVTVLTNQQVYQPGDTVTATVVTSVTGQLVITAPGYSETISLTGSNTTFSFVLPEAMARGTYSIDVIPQNCPACPNEDITLRTAFDVAAPEVRIVDSRLDKGHYEPGETIFLDLTVASDQAVATQLITWIERPDGSTTPGPTQSVNLAASPANLVAVQLTLDTALSGIHHVVYQLVDAAAAEIVHGQGADAFDVGRAIVTNVATDKAVYDGQNDPVQATVTLYATVAMAGELNLAVNGLSVSSQSVNLQSGYQEIVVTLAGGYGRGEHILRATLSEAGLTSYRETGFSYAAAGPDLVAAPPQLLTVSTGTAQIEAVVANRGQEAAGASTATLYEGDPAAGGTAITSFAVPALDSGAYYETIIPWPALNRAGQHLLVLVVDVNDEIDETNETNNEDRDTVAIDTLEHGLTTDQTTYYRSDTAVLTGRVTNLSSTDSLTGLTLETVVYRMNGTVQGTALFTDTRPLPDLLPGQTVQEAIAWPIHTSVSEFDLSFMVVQHVLVNGSPETEQNAAASVIPLLVTIEAQPEIHSHFPIHGEIPTFFLDASDTADIRYQWNSDPFVTYVSPFLGAEGEHTIVAHAERNGIVVGPSVERRISVDVTPPQTTALVDPASPDGENNWYTGPVTITLTATDTGSGVDRIQYSADGVNWLEYSRPLTPPNDGQYTLYYRASDWIGNVETAQMLSLQIDRTPPTLVHNGPFTMNAGEVLTVDGTASTDNLSGLQFTAWDLDGDGVYDDGDPAQFTWPGGSGPYTIALAGVDEAGNVAITSTTVTVLQSETCDLYPIALHTSTLAGASPGSTLSNIYNGSNPGNFGWLTWTGSNSVPSLAASLTPPGNSHTYINPYDANDHLVSVGDWVEGKPGVSNSSQVRNALNLLIGQDIVVPVWDAVEGSGSNTNYHVTAFATVQLISYHLPGQNRITATFVGYATCGNTLSQAPLPVAYAAATGIGLNMPQQFAWWGDTTRPSAIWRRRAV